MTAYKRQLPCLCLRKQQGELESEALPEEEVPLFLLFSEVCSTRAGCSQ